MMPPHETLVTEPFVSFVDEEEEDTPLPDPFR
jgi:hypothetical protein